MLRSDKPVPRQAMMGPCHLELAAGGLGQPVVPGEQRTPLGSWPMAEGVAVGGARFTTSRTSRAR